MRRQFFSVVMVAALVQAGCNLLPETKLVRLFTLPPAAGATTVEDIRPLALSLRVRSLQANQLLSGNRIVVVPEANEISAYGGVRWSDPAPVVLRDRLLEAFTSSHALAAVFNEENRLQPDVELSGTLRAFQSEYLQGSPQIHIQVDLHLTDPTGRQLLASRRFEVKTASQGKSIEQVVAAFGGAADLLSEQVVDWTLQQLAASFNAN